MGNYSNQIICIRILFIVLEFYRIWHCWIYGTFILSLRSWRLCQLGEHKIKNECLCQYATYIELGVVRFMILASHWIGVVCSVFLYSMVWNAMILQIFWIFLFICIILCCLFLVLFGLSYDFHLNWLMLPLV